ncbi:MAG TPA: enoyl-CoA hydratase/isomerase family protein [Candidatus Binatia bacterium]|jgi:enoyl-CoA hydratase
MTVLYDVAARVATITLNRPGCLNAYDVAMRDGLDAALAAACDDPEVRVVVLRGAGRAFSSGGDLREFGSAASPLAARSARFARDVPGRLARLAKPLVAAVHGDAVGGGLEMALLADFCVAAAEARFRLPEAGLGMIPGVGGTQTLPRAIGLGHAFDVALSRRWVSAEEALALGIVTRVVAPEELTAETGRVAAAIAAHAPSLVAAARRAIRDGLDGSLVYGLALEDLLAAGAPEAT